MYSARNAHVATIHDPNPKNSDTHQREQNALTVTPSVAPADTMEQGRGRVYLKELTRDYPKAAVEHGSQARVSAVSNQVILF